MLKPAWAKEKDAEDEYRRNVSTAIVDEKPATDSDSLGSSDDDFEKHGAFSHVFPDDEREHRVGKKLGFIGVEDDENHEQKNERKSKSRSVGFEGADFCARQSSRKKISVSPLERRKSLFQSVKGSLMEQTSQKELETLYGNGQRRRTRKSVWELQREEVSPLTADERRTDVYQRAVLRHQEKMREKEEIVTETQRKTIVAETKRNFQESMRITQSVCMWESILVMMTYAARLNMKLQQAQSIDFFQLNLFPIIFLKAHRFRRKRKLAEYAKTMQKPKLAILQNDDMLRYFGVEHLSQALKTLKPAYFAQGDVVVYQGAEGQEAFIIHEGKADVYANKQYLKTLKPGDVFGTRGMISGEPRNATVKARTTLLCWVISRDEFIEVGKLLDERTTQHAMSIVTELHESKIVSIYPHLLQASQLSRFYLFKNTPVQLLEEFIPPKQLPTLGNAKRQDVTLAGGQIMEPKAFKSGDIIVKAKERIATPLYILRGKISVVVEIAAVEAEWKSLEELLMYHCDIFEIPKTERSDRKAYFESLAKTALEKHEQAQLSSPTNASKRDGNIKEDSQSSVSLHNPVNLLTHYVVGPITAQCLLCCPHILFNEASSVTIEAATSVDVMKLSKHRMLNFLMQDPVSLYNMRRAANKIRSLYIPPLSRPAQLSAMFGTDMLSKFDFLPQLKHSIRFPSAKPVVFDQAETISFVPSQRDILILLRGEIDDAQGFVTSFPCLWPPIGIAYFGNYSFDAKVATRVEAYRLKRVEVVELINSLRPQQLETVQAYLSNFFERRVGRRPTFEATGNEYEDDLQSEFGSSFARTARLGTSGSQPKIQTAGPVKGGSVTPMSRENLKSSGASKLDLLYSSDRKLMKTVFNPAAPSPKESTPHAQSAQKPLPDNLPRHPITTRSLDEAALQQNKKSLRQVHELSKSPVAVFRNVDLASALDRQNDDQHLGTSDEDDDLVEGRVEGDQHDPTADERIPFVPPFKFAEKQVHQMRQKPMLLDPLDVACTPGADFHEVDTAIDSAITKVLHDMKLAEKLSSKHFPSPPPVKLPTAQSARCHDISATPSFSATTPRPPKTAFSPSFASSATRALTTEKAPVTLLNSSTPRPQLSSSLAVPLLQPSLAQQHHQSLLKRIDDTTPFVSSVGMRAPISQPPRMVESPRYLPPKEEMFGMSGESVTAVGRKRRLDAEEVLATLNGEQTALSAVSRRIDTGTRKNVAKTIMTREVTHAPVGVGFTPKFAATKMMEHRMGLHMQQLQERKKLHLTKGSL